MALRELLLPWDAQPQEAVCIDPTLNPVFGFSAPFGFNDIVDGSYYTAAGSGLSIGVNDYGREMDGGGSGMLKRAIEAPAGYPYTCIGIARQDGSGGTKCVSSLATSADKFCRVFLQDGKVLAQHWGATTYANALTTQVFYYGTSAVVVAAFDSPSSVRVWARGLVADAYAENTTNVGSLPALTKAAVMGYSGSADISQLDGGVTLAAWLRLSPTEQQAREWLANPWQIFAPRRIPVPAAAGGGGTTVALSGISATFAQTAPAVSSATPLVGESVTANAGILLPAFSRSLSGQAGTAFAGTLNTSTSRGLSGQSAAFAAGAVIPSVAIAAIGLQATFASGTLTASSSSGTTVNLVGELVAFAQTAPSVNVTIALTGIAATMASGLLSTSSGTAIITVKAGSWLRYKKLQ